MSLKKYPTDILVQLNYANCLFAAGLLLQASNKTGSSLTAYRESEKIVRSQTIDTTQRKLLDRVLTLKLAIMERDAKAIASAADAMTALPGTGWFAPFYAAGGYAVASRKTTTDPEASARYTELALASLRASVAAGLRNPEFIRRSVDLASLVKNPAFLAILDDLAPELAPTPRPVTMPK